MEALKTSIAELKANIQDAKARQKEAGDECKKLEKDMNDFKDNKDSKLKELKANPFIDLPNLPLIHTSIFRLRLRSKSQSSPNARRLSNSSKRSIRLES